MAEVLKKFDFDGAIAESVRTFSPGDCFLVAAKLKTAAVLHTRKYYEGESAALELHDSRPLLASGRMEWVGVWIVPADKRNGVSDQFEKKGTIPSEGMIAFASREVGPEKINVYAAFNRLFPFDALGLHTGPLVAVKFGSLSWEYSRIKRRNLAIVVKEWENTARAEDRAEIIIADPIEGERVRGMIEDGKLEAARGLSLFQQRKLNLSTEVTQKMQKGE